MLHTTAPADNSTGEPLKWFLSSLSQQNKQRLLYALHLLMEMMANDRLADKRVRAAKACQRCNARRVKCDASETGLPCTRCRNTGQAECRLIDTRRGRYSRDQIKARAAAARAENAQKNEGLTPPSSTKSSKHNDTGTTDSANDGTKTISLQYCRGAEYAPSSEGPSPSHSTSPNDAATTASSNESAYRDVSWSAMFQHFLDNRQNNRQDVIDKCSITYLGESFPLALVLEDLQEDGRGRTKLHHAGPPLGQAEQTPSSADRSKRSGGVDENGGHPPHLLPEDMNCLRNKQALEYPEAALFEALMLTFVDVVFPMYPIVSREEFIGQYKERRLPLILLQSACFAAATHCPIEVLNRAGFSGRRQARFFFYRKAKALFDTGYESNKIVILQSIILLSMWGGSPNNYWNFYSWISTGVTIAETLGLHRSIAGTNMDPKDRSLLKRIWWVLVIRDAFCASLVGRPLRVNLDQGDAEMLTLDDFEQEIRSLETSRHQLAGTFAHYQVQAAKLSLILHQIVMTRFIPGQKKYTTAFLQESLEGWRADVPHEIDWSHDPLGNNLLASCLSILFDHHLILANLGGPLSQPSAHDQHSDLAAQRISTLGSSIVVKSQALHVPHETFQGIFLAGVVSYTQMRSANSTIAQLGYSNLNNSKMVLHSVLEAWDPVPWITTLFERLSANLQKKQASDGGVVNQGDMAMGPSSGLSWADANSAGDVLSGQDVDLGICSPWQANPMLNALFDFSNDFSGFYFPGDGLGGGNFGA